MTTVTSDRVDVVDVRVEHRSDPLGVGSARPRLSWRTRTERSPWWQAAYEIEVDGRSAGRVDADDSVLVDWPAAPLASRQRAAVRVRVWGVDGSQSEWSDVLHVEAALLDDADWTARWVSPVHLDPLDSSAPAVLLRHEFELPTSRRAARARLYITSAGIHRAELNGQRVGDHVLAPGWSSYPHRLRYDIHDVSAMIHAGTNAIGVEIADGWWRGHLGMDSHRNEYGDRLGLLAQLEVTFEDDEIRTIASGPTWTASTGAIRAADLYNGETLDARSTQHGWTTVGFDAAEWGAAEEFAPKVGELVAPVGPPVRRIELLPVRDVLTSASGLPILDFGQNLVGRVRCTPDAASGQMITLRHAEVLEHGELATGPLRTAEATDRFIGDGHGPVTWEPEFTFHGFRYVEVDGWPGHLDPSTFQAVVIHSDMERTGTFECSNELLQRFHDNVVWSMRGNFVDLPTDCPQRDERLGWTGDLLAFSPTAGYLYDVSGLLEGWLADLRCEQRDDGAVPVIVPTISGVFLPEVAAGWSDAATFVPWDVYRSSGDVELLRAQFASMRAWVDHVTARTTEPSFWHDTIFQFGDWLDPAAPPDQPWKATTAIDLVATTFYARSAQIVADAAAVIGNDDDAARYSTLAADIRAAFRDEYLTPNGRLVSDTATAYALALGLDLVEDPDVRHRMGAQLERVVRAHLFTISTGFLGTPFVLPALSSTGRGNVAQRLLEQTEAPSWLHSVTLGATTVWERWDSLLPDGTVNPSGMTSFNHYAFGSVAHWMHEHIGGIALGSAGGRHLVIAPSPSRHVTSAAAQLRTPYGDARCSWRAEGTTVRLDVVIPPNCSAVVAVPGADEPPVELGSGRHQLAVERPSADRATADHRAERTP